MQKTIGLLVMLTICCPSWGAVYRWVDESGGVHYSDRPHYGAKEVQIKDAPTYGTPQQVMPSQAPTDNPGTSSAYKTLTINQPENDATIRNNQGAVAVSMTVFPALRGGDKLVVVLDGQTVGKPQASTLFSLKGVERGTHKISVRLVDAENRTLKTSDTITFFMHRPRTNMQPSN